MKNCKTFYETQTASRLKEIIQSPSTPHTNLATSLKQNFLREICRNIQTFAFKVLQESSSWASGNGAVQILFFTPNRNMVAGKFVNEKAFWLCFGIMLFSISKELRFVKWVRFFVRNCMVKCVIFLAGFYWLWAFLLQILE